MNTDRPLRPSMQGVCTIHLHESLPPPPGMHNRAVIDTDALVYNYHTLLSHVQTVSSQTEAIAVVKADAYGHGIRPVAEALVEAGCRRFAVSCIEEAMALREILRERVPDSEVDILILGYTAPENAAILSEWNITATLVSAVHAAALEKAAAACDVVVRVHAALDTGMNRIGYPAHSDSEIADTVEALDALFVESTHLRLDGLFTHFARADEDLDDEWYTDGSLTATQYDRYRRVVDALEARGCRPRVCHICNSAAAVRFPSAHPERRPDAVRLGINLYGYGVPFPDDDSPLYPGLRPVMRLESMVSHVHTLLPGETVGYGGTYGADTPRRIATMPVGYADGWLRALAGATVTLHTAEGDVTAPLVGRICMDQCMVDVTDLPVTEGTRVTLFGQTTAELEALAARAGTITYELLCLITARVPRVYTHTTNKEVNHP